MFREEVTFILYTLLQQQIGACLLVKNVLKMKVVIFVPIKRYCSPLRKSNTQRVHNTGGNITLKVNVNRHSLEVFLSKKANTIKP